MTSGLLVSYSGWCRAGRKISGTGPEKWEGRGEKEAQEPVPGVRVQAALGADGGEGRDGAPDLRRYVNAEERQKGIWRSLFQNANKEQNYFKCLLTAGSISSGVTTWSLAHTGP